MDFKIVPILNELGIQIVNSLKEDFFLNKEGLEIIRYSFSDISNNSL